MAESYLHTYCIEIQSDFFLVGILYQWKWVI